MDEHITLALRAMRHPQTGLAAALTAVAPSLEARLCAVYVAPPGPGAVELLAAGGPEAERLGPPGAVEGPVGKMVRRQAAETAPGWMDTPPLTPSPWADFDALGHVATPLPSGGACLLLAGSSRPGDPERLREASVPVAILAALLASSREMESLRRQLHEVRQSRTLLAAGLQHDLRTPLTSILGCARTLVESGQALDEGDRVDLLNVVATQAERLNEMISEVLVPDTVGPDVPLRLAEADVREVARRVASAAQVGRGGDILIAVDDVRLVTDVPRLERALLNLLDNALKYSPDEQPVHLLGSTTKDGFQFVVADAGSGVTPAIVPTLFRAYSTDPDRSGGVGLGLHSVAALAGDLGGRVTYWRNEGWTRFSLCIPDLRDRERDEKLVDSEVHG
ncbi:MAG TPA: ATP-binding protein [Actinomycetota bacterium]|jgi:signal transduction histidine kinase|nr:ATP-binding protein [Actinomycetota bacterium]